MCSRVLLGIGGTIAATLNSQTCAPALRQLVARGSHLLRPDYQLVFVLSRPSSSLPPYTELKMPALSPTMSQGNLAAWNVKEGDEVAAGDALAEIETDKATMTWETQDDGIIGKLLVPAGAKDVPVGTTMALMVEDAADVPKLAGYSAESTAAPSNEATTATPQPPSPAPSTDDAYHHRIGPAVRMLLESHGLDPETLRHTGPRGALTKGDVLDAVAGGAPRAPPAAPSPAGKSAAGTRPAGAAQQRAASPAAAPTGPAQGSSAGRGHPKHVDIPVSQIRRIIAKRLCESKQNIPHMYVTADVKLDALSKVRAAVKALGHKVSVNDFIIQAVGLSLAQVPAANAFWDATANEVKPFSSVDVCVAVATPTGLITPIVKGANALQLFEVAAAVKDLASRARNNKLKPEEFMGGSFTVSNLGMFGIDHFSAIINPPQAAIMAVGGSRDKVIMSSSGTLSTQSVMSVTLSADQRVYDGEIASKFLEAFRQHIEDLPGTQF